MSSPYPVFPLQVRRLEHGEWLALVNHHTARKWVQDLHYPDSSDSRRFTLRLYITLPSQYSVLLFKAITQSPLNEFEVEVSFPLIRLSPLFQPLLICFSYQISISLSVPLLLLLGHLTVTCDYVPLPTKQEACWEQAGSSSLLHLGHQHHDWFIGAQKMRVD